ncbi:MAG: TatD family hydrolase, partial [Pirellulaceae bacterium]
SAPAMHLIDTHCHLVDEQFDGKRDEILARAVAAQVKTLVAVGTDLGTSRACVELAAVHPAVFATVGIHPNYCGAADALAWDTVCALARSPRVVGLGETGLDRYWDDTPFGVQQDYFHRHLALSQERGLPVVIHMRDCDLDILSVLRDAARAGPVRGVMHSFTGQPETAQECLALGLYLSFAGMVTYKKSDALRQIAAQVPADRLLIETDAPYLSPHPHRGQRPNEPALLVHTARCLAEARGVPLETLVEQTAANASRLFGVPLSP